MSGSQQIVNSISISPPSKTQYLALTILVLLYLIVASTHATLAPLTTGPDELAHYEYVNFIAAQGRLPLNTRERAQASYKSDQPPLYHLITAIPASFVDPTGPPYLKRVGDHPRRQLIERTRHAWGLYNTEDEQWPYRAEVLRWHAGRWVAILFGAATVVVTFFVAREVFAGFRGAGERRSKGAGEQGRGGAEGQESRGVGKQGPQSPISQPAGQTSPNLPISQSLIQNPKSKIQNPKSLALLSAAVVAFIPRFVLTGSMLNYETTVAFFAALFLWILIRIATEQQSKIPPEARRQRHASERNPKSKIFLLGLFAGLAITTKLSAVILPLEIVIGLWLIKRYYDWSWPTWWRSLMAAAVGTLLGVSWWIGFVLYQFNTIAQDGWWTGLLRPLIAADASDATTNRLLSALTGGQAGFTGAIDNLDSGPPWEWAATFFRTFWVAGIEQQQPLGRFGLAVALVLCLVAAYGLVTVWRESRGAGGQVRRGAEEQRSRGAGEPNTTSPQARKRQASRRHRPASVTYHASDITRLILLLLLLHLLLPLALPLIRYAVTFSPADTAQGRHVLFLVAPVFAILLVWGWSVVSYQLSAISHQLPVTNYQLPITNLLSFLPALFLLFWSLTQLWTMTWAYHPLLPVRTVAVAKAQAAEPLNQVVNEHLTLVGFEHQLTAGGQLLRLDLIWLATGISPVDYLTEVRLLDEQKNVRAKWLGYPAGGRYPTRAWDAGDVVRDTVWLPLTGLSEGRYTLTLNQLANSRHQPKTVFDPPQPLTTIELDQSVEPAAGPQIWQDGETVTAPRPFNYRETILVTLGRQFAGSEDVAARLLGPSGQRFEPVLTINDSVLFMVGPDWSTGDYRLQIASTESGAVLAKFDPAVQVIDRWQRQFDEPAMQQRIEANFANQVRLLGYDLGANRAEPGGGIPLTLYWQGLDWLGDDYTIFVKLLAADQSVHGGRDRLPQEGYRTLYWAPGEIIVDPFGLPVDGDAPSGIYTIHIGLYKQVGEQAISLPLVQDGQPLEVTSVSIGPVKIGDTPPGLAVETAEPQVELKQPFGDAPNLTLLGYDLTDAANQPITNYQLPITTRSVESPNLRLTLYWRAETPLPQDYTTFVHLRNAAGEVVAQKDQQPLDGDYPTSLWEPGEIVADEIVLPLPEDLTVADYSLVIGMYDFETGLRLTVPNSQENSLKLTALTAEP